MMQGGERWGMRGSGRWGMREGAACAGRGAEGFPPGVYGVVMRNGKGWMRGRQEGAADVRGGAGGWEE